METVERYPRSDFDEAVRAQGRVLSCVLFVASAVLFVIATDLLGWPWELIPISMGILTVGLLTVLLSGKFRYLGLLGISILWIGILLFLIEWGGYRDLTFLLGFPVALLTVFWGPMGGILGAGAFTLLVVRGIIPSYGWGWGQKALAVGLVWAPVLILPLYRHAALAVLDWAWQEVAKMRRQLDEALAQRVILKQTQEDLVQANLYLERLSERLTLMTRIAEDARQAKERFLANVSHELRTPLNMIIGFSEMIAEHPEIYGSSLPQALLADIRIIQRNSQHLASLVDDILDLSRAEAGRVALIKEWVEVKEIVEAAIIAVKPLFESKGLYLNIDISRDVPPIYCDRTRIRQVILNLLSNAGRFTMAGGVDIRVRYHEGDILFSITDTGPGIAPEDRERVFEPFERATMSVTRQVGGTGLGLSISKHFVEMHGGRMWLESELGKGTTVYFRLPGQEPVRADQDVMRWFNPYMQYEARTRPSRAPAPAVRPRFIVVEPGQNIQRMLRRFYYDADIVSARDLGSAKHLLEQTPANALIFDSEIAESALRQMPLLADLPQATPALVCWAPGERELADQLGVLDYLIKPIDRGRLMSLLDDLGDAVHKVLIVDDDREAIQLLARMLLSASHPYQILRATRCDRALELMRRDQPDLVLLDLVMPDMDGYRLLEIKKEDSRIRDIPVVAITGQIALATLTEGRCITFIRPPNVPLADLFNRFVAIASEMTNPTLRPVDQGPQEMPDA